VQPSVTLSGADVATILDTAGEVDRAMPADVRIPDLLGALAGLVPCDLVFWTRFDVTEPRILAEIGHPHGPLRAPDTAEWIAHRHEHPICSGLHGPVVAHSDVLTREELRASWLYQQCLSRAGWEHEIGLNLSHPAGEIHDIVISRMPGRDFDDRDHLVLRLLHPHLDAALRRLAFPAPRLTEREAEVLRAVREGMNNRQVARHLGIAEATVVKHLERVYLRIGAHSRIQALQLCGDALDR